MNNYKSTSVAVRSEGLIANNLLIVLRKTYDHFGTCFPTLNHDYWIDGINVANNLYNTVGVAVDQAIAQWVVRRKATRTPCSQTIADKMCKHGYI